MKSDIQIAQEAAMLPITQVAEKLNISADEQKMRALMKNISSFTENIKQSFPMSI